MKHYFVRMKAKAKSPQRKAWSKILWSGFGAFLGIYLVAVFNDFFTMKNYFFLLGSFGASAVLIYGAPQAEFSQPRNILGGHIVSAIIGVGVVGFLSSFCSIALMAALSVSLAIMGMHVSRTMHPPGGATALIYVMGGDEIHKLGWLYPITPIGLGALLMLGVALLVNNLSTNSKRHYPTYWL